MNALKSFASSVLSTVKDAAGDKRGGRGRGQANTAGEESTSSRISDRLPNVVFE